MQVRCSGFAGRCTVGLGLIYWIDCKRLSGDVGERTGSHEEGLSTRESKTDGRDGDGCDPGVAHTLPLGVRLPTVDAVEQLGGRDPERHGQLGDRPHARLAL